MKSLCKKACFVLFLFLCSHLPSSLSASDSHHSSKENTSYPFFSDLPSLHGDRKILSDNNLTKKGGVFTIQEDIYGEEIKEDIELIDFSSYLIAKRTGTEQEEIDKDSPGSEAEETPVDDEEETEADPFDEEGEAEKDPFDDEGETEKDPFAEGGETEKYPVPAGIPDNIEGFNRSMYTFNDKMYFWVVKPAAQGYGFILPEVARIGVRNFFDNLSFPVRFFNCLFQGKVKDSGVELARFGINTTVGIIGFIDVAEKIPLEAKIEDFDQTFAVYGFGTGTYIMWPFYGPSSVRGTFALIGDKLFDPVTYIPGAGLLKGLNKTSLRIGDYEALKAASLDPYVAIRDAYFQHRRELINK